MNLFKAYAQLTKSGIILFSVVSAMAGYAVSYRLGQAFDPVPLLVLGLGLYLTCAGSVRHQSGAGVARGFSDAAHPRAAIPRGVFSPAQAYAIGVLLIVPGLFLLRILGPYPAGLALATIVLYNGIYTMYWKRRWVFGAVPALCRARCRW